MNDLYEMVVGLEVHCQVATKTKLFCACSTDGFGAAANSRVCPVCTGQPGVLPVLNRRAVELAFQGALALGCRLAESSIFARKNYFYPDLPKAYQISQYEEPFSRDGSLEIKLKDGTAKVIRIHRIHMEEDAGKLLHSIGAQELDYSLVDFNRAGTPLVEIVSEPDIRGSEEAYAYLSALKEVIQYAGVSRCDMEKGEMRCDANISVRRAGEGKFGTRAEIKNLNSFKGVRDALEYEFRRQVELVEAGGRVVQETRLWDSVNMVTVSMRSKEEAHDYRYFPDPDLIALKAEPERLKKLKAELPELPAARRSRLEKEYGLSPYDAEVLTSSRELSDYFEAAAKARSPALAKTIANFITTDLLGRLNAGNKAIEEAPVSAGHLGELAGLIGDGTLSSKLAKDVFLKMWETGRDPKDLVRDLSLVQVTDEGQIRAWVREALAANPRAAEDLKGGKDKAIGAIVGSVMKLSKGKANPALVQRLIKEQVQA
ncbi:MAG: Asp-tRNA(Asn)/Glu-tRNA(Gln) amidotransferase subunit GatB [Elusimicrobia bacterium]|nr:Asp-tRNA(Asn)/Glu-tRNA(Gln) amidotransferase subunit GatB [Elusimicrobiota bacterium]